MVKWSILIQSLIYISLKYECASACTLGKWRIGLYIYHSVLQNWSVGFFNTHWELQLTFHFFNYIYMDASKWKLFKKLKHQFPYKTFIARSENELNLAREVPFSLFSFILYENIYSRCIINFKSILLYFIFQPCRF